VLLVRLEVVQNLEVAYVQYYAIKKNNKLKLQQEKWRDSHLLENPNEREEFKMLDIFSKI